jgi:putative SOS response-associated peptidase YedK
MCGRLAQTMDALGLAERLGAAGPDFAVLPRYNLAPGQAAAVVAADPEPRLVRMRWGLVPAWAKEEKIGWRMINARAETIDRKPAFRGLLRRRRCLVPADGFFEWQKTGPRTKQPWWIFVNGPRPMAMAGLWDAWRPAEGEPLLTFTIITTRANDLVSRIHDRMPALLSEEALTVWLDPGIGDPARLLPLLRPYPADEMAAYPISDLVNSTANDSPEIIAPVAPVEDRGLFDG